MSTPQPLSPPASPVRSRLLAGARTALGVLGTGLVFVSATAAAAVLHLDTPVARRLLVATLDDALAPSFKGRLRIEKIDRLALARGVVQGVDLVIDDADGQRVVVAKGVSATIAPLRLVRSLVGPGPLDLALGDVRVDFADVVLRDDASGLPSIVGAFDAKTVAPPKAPGEKDKGLSLRLERLYVEHLWAHGATQGQTIDAETTGLVGSLGLDDTRFWASLAPTTLLARALPIAAREGQAKLDAEVSVPLAKDGALSLRANVEAKVGKLLAHVKGTLVGDAFTAHVEVPTFAPDALEAIVAGLKLGAPASVVADAKGTFAHLQATAKARLGDGDADIEASLDRGATLEAKATAKLHDVSLPEAAPAAPAGKVSGEASATAVLDGERLAVTYEVRTEATNVAAQPVPALHTRGTFDGTRLAGTLDAAEPGAPTRVIYALAPEPSRPGVRGLDVDVHADAKSLSRVSRLGKGSPLAGAAIVDAKAHLTLGEQPQVRGEAKVRAAGLSAGGARVAAADVHATFSGALVSPTVHAVVHTRDVTAQGLAIATGTVRVDGPVLSPHVGVALVSPEGDRLDASLALSLGQGVSARNLDAIVGRNGEQLHVRVAGIQAGGGVVQVDGVQIDGDAGHLEASAFYGPGTLRAKVLTAGLDLGVVSRAVGGRLPALKGTLAIDVALDRRPGRTQGHASIAAREVHAPFVDGLDAAVTASIDDRAVSASLEASLVGLGRVAVNTEDARLGGDLLAKNAFTEATGAARTSGQIDLAGALALVPVFFRPVATLEGLLTVNARVARATATAGALPDVTLEASTRGLVVETLPSSEKPSSPTSPAQAAQPSRRFAGIDVAVKSSYVAARNDFVVGAAAADASGSLVEVGLRTAPPVAALVAGGDGLQAKLFETPAHVTVRLPKRALADFPSFVPTQGFKGTAALDVDLVGTVRAPEVRATVELRGFEGVRLRARRSDPIDATMVATFAHDEGQVGLTLDNGGRTVLDANVGGELAWADVIDRREGGPRWQAGGDARFFALPLRPISSVAGFPLAGCLSGNVSVKQLHQDAKLSIDLRVDGLRVKGVPFREARLSGGASDGLARVDAALLQERGELRATGEGGLRWGAALVPTPDFERPAEGSFTAKGFELSPLQPLVDGTLAKLEGKLDADLRYTQASRDPRTGKLRGSLALRDGVVDAVLVGQEFRDVRATVSIDESGEIRLADASFRGSEGRATIEGTAHMAGPVLEDAVARVTIAKREMLPITYQGVDIGQAWGDIRVAAKTRTDGVFALDVDVPRLQLEMPDTPTKSTQSLDAEPTVRIGTHLASAQSGAPPRFVTLPLGDPKKEETAPPDKPSEDPLVTERTVAAAEEAGSKKAAPPPAKGGVVVHITLGPEIRLYKSNQLDLYVKGALDASTLEDKVAVAGLINAERGWVEVQGRRFSVERATVSFDPDRSPSDPTIAATALYVAPDTTRVFADFIGTVANGRLKLRSEPALSQSEILSLVVFGQREGATAGSGAGQKTSSTNRAASLGGGVVTQGLNKALSGISPLEITTRIDTTSSQNPRPEVGVAVTKDVSAAVSFRTGLPTPGQAPDRSLLKLDYRFRPRWSIDTTLGDRGTSIIDLTWKYRY